MKNLKNELEAALTDNMPGSTHSMSKKSFIEGMSLLIRFSRKLGVWHYVRYVLFDVEKRTYEGFFNNINGIGTYNRLQVHDIVRWTDVFGYCSTCGRYLSRGINYLEFKEKFLNGNEKYGTWYEYYRKHAKYID